VHKFQSNSNIYVIRTFKKLSIWRRSPSWNYSYDDNVPPTKAPACFGAPDSVLFRSLLWLTISVQTMKYINSLTTPLWQNW